VTDVKTARMRPRAVGTRDRIMSHLALIGEIKDEHGMASAVLARDVGYPGSSIAFAQLLSGMERSGLIRREVRGKRTYRITLIPDGGPGTVAKRAPRRRAAAMGPASDMDPATGIDYDELARRLLAQVVRHLAPSGTDLEQELINARTIQGTLSAENALLREQLRIAQRNLQLAEQRAGHPPVAEHLDAAGISKA
jgi:hypothetical protein